MLQYVLSFFQEMDKTDSSIPARPGPVVMKWRRSTAMALMAVGILILPRDQSTDLAEMTARGTAGALLICSRDSGTRFARLSPVVGEGNRRRLTAGRSRILPVG